MVTYILEDIEYKCFLDPFTEGENTLGKNLHITQKTLNNVSNKIYSDERRDTGAIEVETYCIVLSVERKSQNGGIMLVRMCRVLH